MERERERERKVGRRGRERERERQKERDRKRETEKERQRERERRAFVMYHRLVGNAEPLEEAVGGVWVRLLCDLEDLLAEPVGLGAGAS
mgnify:CR=1 FL=1